MTKQTYRLTRRHGEWAAGAEIELTADEAQRLDNEAPGVLERIIPATVEREQDRRQGEKAASPRVKGDT